MHSNGTFRACNRIAGKYCFTGRKTRGERHLKKLAPSRSGREFIKRQSGKLDSAVDIGCFLRFYRFTAVYLLVRGETNKKGN